MKLYEISESLALIESALEGGIVEEADIELLAKQYFAAKGKFDDKIHSVGHVMINQESEEVSVKTEIDRLTKRLGAMKHKREWLKNYLKNHMEFNNILKLKFPEFTVSVVKNPSSLEIFDEVQIPSRFLEIIKTNKIKKNEIKDEIKSGKTIPGAKLITNKTNLRIK